MIDGFTGYEARPRATSSRRANPANPTVLNPNLMNSLGQKAGAANPTGLSALFSAAYPIKGAVFRQLDCIPTRLQASEPSEPNTVNDNGMMSLSHVWPAANPTPLPRLNSATSQGKIAYFGEMRVSPLWLAGESLGLLPRASPPKLECPLESWAKRLWFLEGAWQITKGSPKRGGKTRRFN